MVWSMEIQVKAKEVRASLVIVNRGRFFAESIGEHRIGDDDPLTGSGTGKMSRDIKRCAYPPSGLSGAAQSVEYR